jgi:hypothetical protein
VFGACRDNPADSVTRRELIGPVAPLLVQLELPVGGFSEALFQAIVLDSLGDPLRAEAALQAVRLAPERVLLRHRGQIFARAWSYSRQPIDPYDPNTMHSAARAAATALIIEHEDIRSTALGDLPPTAEGRTLQLVYAAALQGMRGPLGAEVGRVVAALKPGSAALEAFARDSDRDFSSLDPVIVSNRSRIDGALRRLARRLAVRPGWPRVLSVSLALACVPGAFVGLAFVVNAIAPLPHHVQLALPPILAVAGVLVAIHVVAAELAADRLPGLVARATSVPLALWAGYGAVGALLSVVAVSSDLAHGTRSVIEIGLIAAIVVSFAVALQQLLSRTDNTVAARIFVTGELARARRSGKAVGQLHRVVLKQRSALSSVAWVRPSSSPPLSLQRLAIVGEQSGYLLCRPRLLARLDRSGWWREGGRMWVYGVLGAQVEPGDEIASVVLPSDGTIGAEIIAKIHRIFTVRNMASSERSAEAVVSLIAMTAQLAEDGNEAGANHVGTQALRLFEAHVNGLNRARGPLGRQELGAPVVVARSAALSVTRTLMRANHPTAEQAVTTLAQRFLPLCGRGDSFLPILIRELGTFPERGGDPSIAALLLQDCGYRAVELKDEIIMRLWWEAAAALETSTDQRRSALALESRIVQRATSADAFSGSKGWGRLIDRLDPTKRFDLLLAVRVGASALLPGHISLATTVAVWLREASTNWSGLREHFAKKDVQDGEVAYDAIHGHLLGTDVTAAIEDFLYLGESIGAHLR